MFRSSIICHSLTPHKAHMSPLPPVDQPPCAPGDLASARDQLQAAKSLSPGDHGLSLALDEILGELSGAIPRSSPQQAPASGLAGDSPGAAGGSTGAAGGASALEDRKSRMHEILARHRAGAAGTGAGAGAGSGGAAPGNGPSKPVYAAPAAQPGAMFPFKLPCIPR